MQSPSASDLANYFSLTQTQKLLRYGNYFTQLKPFLKVFKADEIIFYNGNRLGKIQNIVLETHTQGKPSDLDQFEAESIEDLLKLGHEMVFDFDKAKEGDLRPYAIFRISFRSDCPLIPSGRISMFGKTCSFLFVCCQGSEANNECFKSYGSRNKNFKRLLQA